MLTAYLRLFTNIGTFHGHSSHYLFIHFCAVKKIKRSFDDFFRGISRQPENTAF